MPAAPARADDASLFEAYTAKQDGALAKATTSYLRHARRFVRSRRRAARKRWARAVIRDDARINRVITGIRGDIVAVAPSTDDGARAKSFALAEIDGWKQANRLEVRSLRAYIRGRERRFRRLMRRAGAVMHGRAYPSGKKAVRAFRAAGFESDAGALSA